MVVSTRAEKGRLRAELRHQIQAEHVAVERDRRGDRRHLQVHVTHHDVWAEPVKSR